MKRHGLLRGILAVAGLAAVSRGQSTRPAIIPAPTAMQVHDGVFTLKPQTALLVGPGAEKEALYLQQTLAVPTGVTFGSTSTDDPGVPAIRLMLTEPAVETPVVWPVDESYVLDVTPTVVTFSAKTTAGLFDAIQTFRQLLPVEAFADQPRVGVVWSAPCVHIEDSPRFAYRGLHLDCVRHFFPKAFVLRYIDLAATHKFNYFHWHLTDDQGWRLEIKKYPKLTQVGAWRSESLVGHPGRGETRVFDGIPHGGFYTQEDVREVVAYAAARHVIVMPEIEMPGHSRAAIAAYPELGLDEHFIEPATAWGQWGTLNVNDSTVEFYKDILGEVLELFPSRFIHCGGDEVVLRDWTNNPAMREKMDQMSTTNPALLQAAFMEKMDAFLTSKGRRMVGWDEILDGHLAPGATVMSWRGISGGASATAAGHDVIMTPGQFCYLDHYQSQNLAKEPLAIGGFLPLESVYAFDPVATLSPEQARHVLGGQGNVWAEYLPTTTQVEYMVYPRACAMAEALWSQSKPAYPDFYARLQTHLKRLGLQRVNFRRLDGSTTKPAQDF